MSTEQWQQSSPPDVTGRTRAVWRWVISRPSELTATRRALGRRLAAADLPGRADEDDLARLLLAFEELTSNGLRHSGAPVEVTVTGTTRGWLVDVSDSCPDQPPAPVRDRDPADGGMGLHLVDVLSTSRGWSVSGGRKQVWACITPLHP